jgi:UDP-N-acetylglucosamine--N-acetylmuramyl-(pentapeptide) pyrophosphoryl-undecaprenol N-acetylglucosamine transferase
LGIFTLYVPLPIGNGEQLQNAQIVTASGGGMIIENSKFTSEWLSENLAEIMSKASVHSLSTVRTHFPLGADAQVGRRILELLR